MSIRVVPFAAVLAFAIASSATAHGGSEVYAGREGPYFVQAFVSEVSGVDEQSGKKVRYVDYTISLRNATTSWAVDNATVKVAARTPAARIGPVDAQGFANQYQALFPYTEPGSWTMTVDVTGPPGRAVVEHSMTVGTGGGGGFDWGWLLFSLAAVAFAAQTLGRWSWRQLRRRLSTTPEQQTR